MNIKHEPPSDAEIADSVASKGFLLLPHGISVRAMDITDEAGERLWSAYATDTRLEDMRNATAPIEPIAVHGEQDD